MLVRSRGRCRPNHVPSIEIQSGRPRSGAKAPLVVFPPDAPSPRRHQVSSESGQALLGLSLSISGKSNCPSQNNIATVGSLSCTTTTTTTLVIYFRPGHAPPSMSGAVLGPHLLPPHPLHCRPPIASDIIPSLHHGDHEFHQRASPHVQRLVRWSTTYAVGRGGHYLARVGQLAEPPCPHHSP